MNGKNWLLLLFALPLLMGCGESGKHAYQIMSGAEAKTRLEEEDRVVFVAASLAGESCTHYIPSETVLSFPFPPAAPEESKAFAQVVERLKGNELLVVIVCPRDKDQARPVYDRLARAGIARDRLFILAEGKDGWPYVIEG